MRTLQISPRLARSVLDKEPLLFFHARKHDQQQRRLINSRSLIRGRP